MSDQAMLTVTVITTSTVTTSIDTTPIRKTPHGRTQLVACRRCSAPVGRPCVTASGLVAVNAHRARWDSFNRAMGSRDFLAVACSDDPGWSSGDLLWCHVYAWDRSKSTVVQNLTTRTDPERNVYNVDIDVLRILDQTWPS